MTPQKYDFEILVVDDGSTDNTANNVTSTGVRLLQHPENRGYGAALKSGILAAANEVIVIIDADGTYPVDQIPLLVEKLETADMVVGARVGENVHIPLDQAAGQADPAFISDPDRRTAYSRSEFWFKSVSA